jgi:low affinity Fe/Cu permease
MVQATFTVSGSEFNAQIFEQIRQFISNSGKEFEVMIKVKTKETPEEMRLRIEKAMDDTEKGINLIHFSGNDYEELVQKLTHK